MKPILSLLILLALTSPVAAQVPDDAARSIPGWYLLFALVDDIPSQAKVIRLLP